jgi:hypothetical protein
MKPLNASFTSEAFSNWTKWPEFIDKISKSFTNGCVLSTWKLAIPVLSSFAVIKRTGLVIGAAEVGMAID